MIIRSIEDNENVEDDDIEEVEGQLSMTPMYVVQWNLNLLLLGRR